MITITISLKKEGKVVSATQTTHTDIQTLFTSEAMTEDLVRALDGLKPKYDTQVEVNVV